MATDITSNIWDSLGLNSGSAISFDNTDDAERYFDFDEADEKALILVRNDGDTTDEVFVTIEAGGEYPGGSGNDIEFSIDTQYETYAVPVDTQLVKDGDGQVTIHLYAQAARTSDYGGGDTTDDASEIKIAAVDTLY